MMKSREYVMQIVSSHRPHTERQWLHTGSNGKRAKLWW